MILWIILQTVAGECESFEKIVSAVQNAVPECEEEMIKEQLGQLLLLGYLDIGGTSELSYGLTDQGSEVWRKHVARNVP